MCYEIRVISEDKRRNVLSFNIKLLIAIHTELGWPDITKNIPHNTVSIL